MGHSWKGIEGPIEKQLSSAFSPIVSRNIDYKLSGKGKFVSKIWNFEPNFKISDEIFGGEKSFSKSSL